MVVSIFQMKVGRTFGTSFHWFCASQWFTVRLVRERNDSFLSFINMSKSATVLTLNGIILQQTKISITFEIAFSMRNTTTDLDYFGPLQMKVRWRESEFLSVLLVFQIHSNGPFILLLVSAQFLPVCCYRSPFIHSFRFSSLLIMYSRVYNTSNYTIFFKCQRASTNIDYRSSFIVFRIFSFFLFVCVQRS